MSLELDVRAAFVSHAGAIAGVGLALDHEPAALEGLEQGAAIVTMLGLPPAQRDAATGRLVELSLSWRVNVYVRLRDYAEAQHELASLLPALLAITRSDPNAGGLVDTWELTGDGREPTFAHAEGWILQTLSLRSVSEAVA